MKTESLKFAIRPYGSTVDAFKVFARQSKHHFASGRVVLLDTNSFQGPGQMPVFWVTTSGDLDKIFVERFREHSTAESRLLVVNDRKPSDYLLTQILDLQIRTAERVYVADCRGSTPKEAKVYLSHLIHRLVSVGEEGKHFHRILDAKVEAGDLYAVSTSFKRIKIPLSLITDLAGQDPEKRAAFEIDEDGAFVWWPDLDVHLGWDQLEQLADPHAAFKAKQKMAEFNIRYGQAVQKVRELAAVSPADIELSEKQLGRIERGECRLTSRATEALAKAHGLTANAYLQKLAEAMPA